MHIILRKVVFGREKGKKLGFFGLKWMKIKLSTIWKSTAIGRSQNLVNLNSMCQPVEIFGTKTQTLNQIRKLKTSSNRIEILECYAMLHTKFLGDTRISKNVIFIIFTPSYRYNINTILELGLTLNYYSFSLIFLIDRRTDMPKIPFYHAFSLRYIANTKFIVSMILKEEMKLKFWNLGFYNTFWQYQVSSTRKLILALS